MAVALCLSAPALAAFTVNPDGTVTDSETGLIWDQCTWGQSGAGCDGTGDAGSYYGAMAHTWAEALGMAIAANTANYKGHNDWRLPNRTELESLADITRSSPALDTTYFPNTVSTWYWSSTIYAPLPTYAWGVSFADGNTYANLHGYGSRVRLVRGGQSFDAFDALGSDDDDGDGVPDAVENAGPNGGDGNDDGTPDSVQNQVATLAKGSGGGYLTLTTNCAAGLTGVETFPENHNGSGQDPQFNLPYGVVGFSAACESAQFTVYYHGVSSVAGMTYRKYGPTTPGDAGTTGWYTLPGVTFGVAVLNGTATAAAVFNLNDNVLGDDTGDDGVIVDQGGPGNGQSSATQPVPVLGPLGLLLLSGLLGLFGFAARRR